MHLQERSAAICASFLGVTEKDLWNLIGQNLITGFSFGSIVGALTGGIGSYKQWFQARALEFTHTGLTNEVVLGRSADNYNVIAESRKATYFYTTDARWNTVKNMRFVGEKGMWKINKIFLKNQIALGRTFYLASNPVTYGFFGKELAYLSMLGLVL